jgi:hypothetical protein
VAGDVTTNNSLQYLAHLHRRQDKTRTVQYSTDYSGPRNGDKVQLHTGYIGQGFARGVQYSTV